MKVSGINNYFADLRKYLDAQKVLAKASEKSKDFNKKLFEASVKRADEIREAQKDPQHLINLLV